MTDQFMPPENLVFILGLQRSGTTWLANIFDAHPSTMMFMEPFSLENGLIPEFPDTSYFLSGSSPYLEQFLRDQFLKRIHRHKTLLFSDAFSTPSKFRFERWVVNKLSPIRFLMPQRYSNRIHHYKELNFNRFDDNYRLQADDRYSSTWVIKELRLAGKIPILLQAYPEAKLIAIIRHPCATVHSILKWFDRGRLRELRRELDTFLEKIQAQKIAECYASQIESCKNGTLAHKVALYWRISYETMIRQLEESSQGKVIAYEQLALDPLVTAKCAFDFASVPWTSSVSDYIAYSSETKTDNPNTVTTTRNSSTYYRSWQEDISPSVQEIVMSITDDSFLLSRFEPFYT